MVSLRISLEKDALMAGAGWGGEFLGTRTAQTKLRQKAGGTDATFLAAKDVQEAML